MVKPSRYVMTSIASIVCGLAVLPVHAQSYVSTVLSDHPALFYTLGDTSGTVAVDQVGVNNGTYEMVGTDPSGGYTLGQPGINGAKAVSFYRDTSTLYPPSWGEVTAPTTTGLPTGDSSFTLEAWIDSNYQGDSGFVDRPNILSYGDDVVDQKIGLQLEQGTQPLVGVYFYGNDYFFSVPDLTGVWHYLAVTYTGAGSQSLTLYLDGTSVGSQTVNGTPDIQQGNLEIGALSPFNQDAFSGRIQDVAIYGTALSAARIEAHYAANTVPEPSAFALLVGMGAMGLIHVRRRK